MISLFCKPTCLQGWISACNSRCVFQLIVPSLFVMLNLFYMYKVLYFELYHFLLPGNEVAERLCFHKRVSRILSTGGVHPMADTPPGRHPPRADTPQTNTSPPNQTPSQADTPLGRHPPRQTATVADGTHPIGKHSCCL